MIQIVCRISLFWSAEQAVLLSFHSRLSESLMLSTQKAVKHKRLLLHAILTSAPASNRGSFLNLKKSRYSALLMNMCFTLV